MSKLHVKCPGCGGHALFVSQDEVRRLIAEFEDALTNIAFLVSYQALSVGRDDRWKGECDE